MTPAKKLLVSTALGTALVLATSQGAWAVYNQTVTLTGDNANDIAGSALSFAAADPNVSVTVEQVEENDDERSVFILTFPGDAVGGSLVIAAGTDSEKSVSLSTGDLSGPISVNLNSLKVSRDSKPSSMGQKSTGRPNFVWTNAVTRSDVDLPDTGAGFVSVGGGEKWALRHKVEINMIGYDTGVATEAPWGGTVSAFGGYWRGSDRSDGSIGVGTYDTGFVYGDLFNGSSGLDLGAVGLTIESDADARFQKFGFGFGCDPRAFGDMTLRPSGRIFYANLEQEFSSFQYSPTYGLAISQELDQEISTDFWGLDVAVDLEWPISDRLSVGTTFSAGALHWDSELKSVEHNICGLCAAPQDDFTLRIQHSDDGWTWNGGVGVYGDFKLRQTDDNSANLRLSVNYSYTDEMSGINNMQSGDQVFLDGESTGLYTDDAWSLSYQIGMSLTF